MRRKSSKQRGLCQELASLLSDYVISGYRITSEPSEVVDTTACGGGEL